MFLQIIIGGIAAIAGIWLANFFKLGRPIPFWGTGLIVAAGIYIGFAIFAKNWEWVQLEVGGLLLYSSFVLFAKKFHPAWLAIGWAAHVLWDLLLHPNGHPGFVPDWYPGVCLGFDLIIGGYLLWYIFIKKTVKR